METKGTKKGKMMVKGKNEYIRFDTTVPGLMEARERLEPQISLS
jgi:hypothetical protein